MNLLVCEVCRPSWIEVLTNANRRAVSTSDQCWDCAVSRVTLFHTAQCCVRYPCGAKSCASCFCSGVRSVLVAEPRRFTSPKSAAYAALVIDGGALGRYCVEVSSANGTTLPNCGNDGGWKAGGV